MFVILKLLKEYKITRKDANYFKKYAQKNIN